jgi:hypothetical protein
MRLLIAYLAERFHLRLYLPLAMMIAVSASGGELSGWGLSAARLGTDATFALLLLAQFRAWDDLADRHRDAVTHPERILVRATATATAPAPAIAPATATASAMATAPAPIVTFCALLAAVNIGLALRRDASGVAAVVLLTLIATLGAWYALRDADSRTLAGDHLLLSKYPAMVIIVAGGRVLQEAPARILGAALALHVAACVYEGWHDPASPLSVGGHR